MDETFEPVSETRSLSAEIVRARAAVICALERRGIAPEEAEDLAHEACLAALRRAPDPDGPAGLFPWLFVVAWRARRRRRDGALESEPETAEASAEERVLRREDMELLMAGFSQLSERERRVFTMRYVERIDLATIALRMRAPLGTIKSMLFRARQAMIRRPDGRSGA